MTSVSDTPYMNRITAWYAIRHNLIDYRNSTPAQVTDQLNNIKMMLVTGIKSGVFSSIMETFDDRMKENGVYDYIIKLSSLMLIK